MTVCCECGSTTIPLWYSDGEWSTVNVCMKCVQERHLTVVKHMTIITSLSSMTMILFGLMFVVAFFLTMEAFILLAFCPYPLYGEKRRRYKEWKRLEKEAKKK